MQAETAVDGVKPLLKFPRRYVVYFTGLMLGQFASADVVADGVFAMGGKTNGGLCCHAITLFPVNIL